MNQHGRCDTIIWRLRFSMSAELWSNCFWLLFSPSSFQSGYTYHVTSTSYPTLIFWFLRRQFPDPDSSGFNKYFCPSTPFTLHVSQCLITFDFRAFRTWDDQPTCALEQTALISRPGYPSHNRLAQPGHEPLGTCTSARSLISRPSIGSATTLEFGSFQVLKF